MDNTNANLEKQKRSIYILALVNVGIWAISIIGMVFLMQHSPNVRMLFPILGGGVALGVALMSGDALHVKCNLEISSVQNIVLNAA